MVMIMILCSMHYFLAIKPCFFSIFMSFSNYVMLFDICKLILNYKEGKAPH